MLARDSADRRGSECEVGHGGLPRKALQFCNMEVFLHLWDELDDLIGAARHVAAAAALELAGLSRPLVGAAGAGYAWLLCLTALKGP